MSDIPADSPIAASRERAEALLKTALQAIDPGDFSSDLSVFMPFTHSVKLLFYQEAAALLGASDDQAVFEQNVRHLLDRILDEYTKAPATKRLTERQSKRLERPMPLDKQMRVEPRDKWDIFSPVVFLPNKKDAVRRELKDVLGGELAYWLREGASRFSGAPHFVSAPPRASESRAMATDSDEADRFLSAYKNNAKKSDQAVEAIKRIHAAPKLLVRYPDLVNIIWELWKIPPNDVSRDDIERALYLLSRKYQGGVELDPVSCRAAGFDPTKRVQASLSQDVGNSPPSVDSAERKPTASGNDSLEHLELSQPARDRIEAAELSAQSILEGFQQDGNSLTTLAYEMGVSASELDFAPGNTVLQAAYSKGVQGRELAADLLFRATAVEYWRLLEPDVEAFANKLGTIWQWTHQRFQVSVKITESCVRDWRAWALRERAASGRGSSDQIGDSTQPQGKKAGVVAELPQTVVKSTDAAAETSPAGSEPRAGGPDASDTDRGKIRSAWLDAKRVAKEWTSDLDIQNNGGPTYNTIGRYRSGRRTTRESYVRIKLAKAFGCDVTEVPK